MLFLIQSTPNTGCVPLEKAGVKYLAQENNPDITYNRVGIWKESLNISQLISLSCKFITILHFGELVVNLYEFV